MVWWSNRRRARPEPGLRPSVVPTELVRVDFTDLAPEPIAFLGQAAAIQLEFFEGLSRAVATAPDLVSKEGLSAAAGVALRKHHALIAELRREGVEPVTMMQPFAAATERFREITSGDDWYELLLGIHVTSGILDDFFSRLAEGLPSDLGARVRVILAEAGAGGVLEQRLSSAIADVPGLADRLALWGRSLVGDTLLVARSALRTGGDDQAVEPVFTELIAEHTRRMDALGLTA
ncbi:ferritin-like fold-containing protein [Agromyces larvae]|uniref:Ferritin-like domain-containing protein n=1 Tax=Agromyces larvae TaxID=2929802 RepID=A0ABY4C2L0_9MICO|nr:ferritin-like fold-containing protein [Agromyces larvae]UOE45603.1 ferritin-like domain-containing protein [Agromyces larvae]